MGANENLAGSSPPLFLSKLNITSKLKVVIATPCLPWPLTEGGRVAQYRTLEALGDACDFTLVFPAYTWPDLEGAREFSARMPNVRVEAVRCADIAKFPLKPSQVARMLRARVRPLFATAARSQAETLGYPFGPLNPRFTAAVADHVSRGCDIFQAEFSEMLSLGPLISRTCPSVLVHHQPHFLYAKRFLEAVPKIEPGADYLFQRMQVEERSFLETFDATIVFSDIDQAALREFCPGLAVHSSPFPAPLEPAAEAPIFDAPIQEFAFIGSAGHPPNVQGLTRFVGEAWPAIQQRLPQATLEVIGNWPPSARTQVANGNGVRFLGHVPDLAMLRDKIMVVPVWIGSGIRTKILSAWSIGCPVVTTTIGAEGLSGIDGEHYLAADSPKELAEACIKLSRDTAMLNRLCANGLAIAHQRYSLAAVRERRLEIYAELLGTSSNATRFEACSTR